MSRLIHGLYKKYREQFFPDVTIRRSALAPSGIGGEESDLQNAPSVSRLRAFVQARSSF